SPPCPESRSFSISACERFSRLPRGPTRASMNSESTTLLSMLGKDIDRRAVAGEEPYLDHVGVGDGDAAVGPVIVLVVPGGVLQAVRQPVDHDRAAGLPVVHARTLGVLGVGVRDLNGQEVIAARIAPRQAVPALRSAEIAVALLRSDRLEAKRNFVRAYDSVAIHEIQAA